MTREASIQRAFVRAVKQAGGWPIKLKGPRGWPDYVVFWRGSWPEWVELKAPGKKPRASQIRMHQRLTEYEQLVYVISSREEIDAFIEGHL